ncbi:MAG TPA: SRPBCC family protein [Gaiellaceae bacterium]|jgi:uncharacterized protein YndB with AHSA1/START domain|nr:SRPBCC family protein [Gaiellaceae bacterium]
MTTTTAQATQVYQLFIKASPEAIWDAITKPEFTVKYFYGSRVTVTPQSVRGLGPGDEVWADSETIEFDPPRRLVHGWKALYDPELAEEEPSRVTWEIEPQDGGFCRLTVVHDQLEGAPRTAENVAGGWMFILSGLKTLVETGEGLAG